MYVLGMLRADPFVCDNEWACGRAARDGRGTRRQSSGQGQIQGYRTDANYLLL